MEQGEHGEESVLLCCSVLRLGSLPPAGQVIAPKHLEAAFGRVSRNPSFVSLESVKALRHSGFAANVRSPCSGRNSYLELSMSGVTASPSAGSGGLCGRSRSSRPSLGLFDASMSTERSRSDRLDCLLLAACSLQTRCFPVALSEIDRSLLDRCLNRKPRAWEDFVDRFMGWWST